MLKQESVGLVIRQGAVEVAVLSGGLCGKRSEASNKRVIVKFGDQPLIGGIEGNLEMLRQLHVQGVVERHTIRRSQGDGGCHQLWGRRDQVHLQLVQSRHATPDIGDTKDWVMEEDVRYLIDKQIRGEEGRLPAGVIFKQTMRGRRAGFFDEPLDGDRGVNYGHYDFSRSLRRTSTEFHPAGALRRKRSIAWIARTIFSRSRTFNRNTSSTVAFICFSWLPSLLLPYHGGSAAVKAVSESAGER